MLVRHASTADAASLAVLGITAATEAVTPESDVVLIAEDCGAVLGYAVLDRSFFGRPFVRMVFVRTEYRRQGVGNALLTAAVAESAAERTFTSTNLSNTPMQRALKALGWQACGMLHGLDEGDPEIFYFAEGS